MSIKRLFLFFSLVVLVSFFFSEEVFAQTEPGRVRGLSATAISPNQIDLSWDEPSDGGSPITGYQIERKKASDAWEIYIADTGNTNTTYSDQGLEPDTRYRYKVSAINAIDIGRASTASAATTLAITEPDRVTGLSATAISPNQIDLSWDEPYDGESPITGYQIERRKTGDSWIVHVADTGNQNTSYSDLGLISGTEYSYRVSAINAIDIGRASTVVTTTTLGPTLTEPDRVTGLSATAISPNQIDLSWDEPSDGGSPITGYQIERKKASDAWEIYIADTGNTNTTYSDQGLEPDTRYRYKVSAINAIGMGTASTVKTATTLAITEPDRVTGLSATVISQTQIDLSWNEPYDGESQITGYQIERKKASDAWEIYIADTGNTNTTYSDQGLEPDTRYRYKVSAINAIGMGTASATVSATTLAPGVPSAPLNLQGSPTCCTVNLTWTTPYHGGSPIIDYIIEYSDDGNNWNEFNDGLSIITSVTVTGLATDTEYHFRVFAVNSVGTGPSSNVITSTPTNPLVSTGSDDGRAPPQIHGIGIYKFSVHQGDDGEKSKYKEQLNVPFDLYFPYSKHTDKTDFENYKEIGEYKKHGTYYDLVKKINTPKFVAKLDQPVQFQIRLWDLYASTKIEHLSLYMSNTETPITVGNSDTEIIYEKGKPIEVKDPNDIFKEIKFSTSFDDEWLWVNFDIVFQKPLKTSGILLEAWHETRDKSSSKIDNILEILDHKDQEKVLEDINLTAEVEVTHGASNPTCKIDNSCFTPYDAKILEDGIVTWVNTDALTHTVTSGTVDQKDNRFGYLLFPGDTVQHKFSNQGIYNYYCALHPWATGNIYVYGQDMQKPDIDFDESLSPLVAHTTTSSGSLVIENEGTFTSTTQNLKIKVSGHIQELTTSNNIEIIIVHPDKTSEKMKTVINNDGFYSLPIVLNKHWEEGTYQIITKYHGKDIAKISFNVTDELE
ncbi:fibronectin type III domain-containing protein [Nitrosopumilus sp.]|uniref:fibronectin type III domain-containing protein n=1 Tax=Nitrosopumilus sp. TaxID=2024843 RepID=UPI003D0E8082